MKLTDEVLGQYERIRRSGQTNMFDRSAVRRLAESRGYDELVQVIDDGDYAQVLEQYDADRADDIVGRPADQY